MNIIGDAMDNRTNTRVYYAQTTINEYIGLIGEHFDEFEIQRKREKHKAYDRMRRDITLGTLLPAIILAVKPEFVGDVIQLGAEDRGALAQLLSRPNTVNILDGLQRTFILKELVEGEVEFNGEQSLLLEFWIEPNLEHLIYRIIVLNAGQKPMSMRHQVELLFLTIKGKLEQDIPGLEIYSERDQTRRRGANKFALDRIATAYQCFVTAQTEVSRDNIVAQRLVDENILDSTEEHIAKSYADYKHFLSLYSGLDVEVCRVYTEARDKLPTGANWFGSENVMNAFFAAISSFGSNEERRIRIEHAIDSLRTLLTSSNQGDDPLALSDLMELIDGINVRKVNVGLATRRILFHGFKEYFREEGALAFAKCWLAGSE
ncbi:MAG: hypothetical protein ACLGQW_08945 [Acidobacteriota bacterium]